LANQSVLWLKRVILGLVLVFGAIAITVVIYLNDRPMARMSPSQVAMSPNGTAFAYALDYKFSPGMFFDFRQGCARVEIWTYDLSRRIGPRRIGGWNHPYNEADFLDLWTTQGLYLVSNPWHGEGEHAPYCELISPEDGSHHLIGPPPWEEIRKARHTTDSNRPDYRQTRHVEVRNGEFFLWDPVALKLDRLFALAPDPYGYDPTGDDLTRSRNVAQREEGIQRIEKIDTAEFSDGIQLCIHTFARRPAAFARRYRFRFEIDSDEQGKDADETEVRSEALWDTLMTPSPAGDNLVVRIPYSRFWRTLRPERELVRRYGPKYFTHLITTLVPDSLSGDEGMAPGLRDGYALSYWSEVVLPLP